MDYSTIDMHIPSSTESMTTDYDQSSVAPISPSYTTGYDANCFGNDPLKHSHYYKPPTFTSVHWVDGYHREDGTYVKGHFRSDPDNTTANNLNR
ncbi:MAG: hypothetical protein UHX00_03310 [Caryophanon sp.]|uniref:Uncharacterized protein n=1 Tax=Caryophanon latum TaxID=33977 RepID=A0A1C0YB47_9BACL|nr:hypothetical protein [Caryophanon latum]MEE1130641.1 hypothetical protein [Caryophanon sp.]OCS84353.1 hypothetical protein A6K76_15720 [Caryophanon latum]